MYVLPAGNDVEMGGGSFNFQKIPELVASGKLDVESVNTAVSRLLTTKFTMGIFENPYLAVPADGAASNIHTPAHIELARQLDAESIVLLENHNSTLPLKQDANVAIIRHMADGFMNVSTYVYLPVRQQLTGASTVTMLCTSLSTAASRLSRVFVMPLLVRSHMLKAVSAGPRIRVASPKLWPLQRLPTSQ